jgi:SAM-dependent methyltransferase
VEDTVPRGDELERWNRRFAEEGYHFGTAPNAFLVSQAARLAPDMSALLVADGEGRNSVWLAQRGLAVTAFDFSPVAVRKARALASENGVTIDFRLCELADWDWDARQFDVVAGIFVQFAAPPERARMFAGMCRTLRPGGLLLLQGYRPEQIAYGTGGPSRPEHLYTAAMLKQAFAALDILELREHDEEVHEGKGHDGMSALMELVARRPR